LELRKAGNDASQTFRSSVPEFRIFSCCLSAFEMAPKTESSPENDLKVAAT
jgi:hypothetical protein